MAFKRKEHIRSKICVYDKPIEKVFSFELIGYNISYENNVDISTKIFNYNRTTGIINQIFKPSLVQKHTRIKICKTLAPCKQLGFPSVGCYPKQWQSSGRSLP
jgi:hypothetical protein